MPEVVYASEEGAAVRMELLESLRSLKTNPTMPTLQAIDISSGGSFLRWTADA